ncbi:MAG: hypothetical protein LBR90_00340 [Elusimicrobiota bacterium]|jgi:hypothetical protein|nr:hypothetical protein [Elusimicrobiota bacterium]
MKKLFFLTIALSALNIYAFCADIKTPGFTIKEHQNALEEDKEMQAVLLKYRAAPAAQKPAVKKEITALETKNEQERLQKHALRLARQEAKIKELKKEHETRTKNVKQNVAARVEYLTSEENLKKIKEKPQSAPQEVKTKDKPKK